MSDVELVTQRRQTEAMIKADPTSLRFERHVTKRNNRGGTEVMDENWTAAQTVRFIRSILPRNRVATDSTTAGQKQRCYDKVLCQHDADIKAGDTFDFEGQRWVVQKLLTRTYEILADVELRDGELRN